MTREAKIRFFIGIVIVFIGGVLVGIAIGGL